MEPARWARIEDVFARAVELPAADRAAFVAAECGDDQELRDEILGLLAAEDRAAASLRDIVDAGIRPTVAGIERPTAPQRPRQSRLTPIAAVVLAVLVCVVATLGIVALSGEPTGQAVRTWELRAGEHRVAVTFPGHLRDAVPEAGAAFSLHANVELGAAQRGRALALVVDCFHAPLVVMVDGELLEDEGHGGGGSWRLTIPERLTQDGVLDVSLQVEPDFTSSIGFGVAPRITSDPRGDARGAAIAGLNHYTAIAAICFSLAFAFVYLGVWIYERRANEYVAMIVVCVSACNLPLLQLGFYRAVFGSFGVPVNVLLGLVNNFATVTFVQIFFGVPRLWRGWYAAAGLFVALAFGSVGVPAIAATLQGVQGLVTTAVNAYVITVFVRELRGDQRTDALISLIGFVPILLSIGQLLAWAVSGRNLLSGFHPSYIAMMVGTGAQALVLGRRHAARQRTIEQTSEELRRQVVERSRELADALAKLGEQQGAMLAAGYVVDGRYRVIRSLGAGGMGAVYEVERTKDLRRLALKTLRGRADTKALARFAREAQLAAELAHPNLVPVHDVGIADGSLYLVMELVTGSSLDHEHARFGDAKWALPLLRQIATGLAAMHARGIVHRDLKPANVLLAHDVARIADFGLASLHETVTPVGEYDATTPHAPQLTRSGDVFGTPIYMGPELAVGTAIATPAADIFSFGVLACELLAGERPFAEPPVVSRLNGTPVGAPQLAGIPAGIRPLIARCLDQDPKKRPTAEELVVGLAGDSRLP